jgi:hypothetical protein
LRKRTTERSQGDVVRKPPLAQLFQNREEQRGFTVEAEVQLLLSCLRKVAEGRGCRYGTLRNHLTFRSFGPADPYKVTRIDLRMGKDNSDDCPLNGHTFEEPRAKALDQSAYVGAVKGLKVQPRRESGRINGEFWPCHSLTLPRTCKAGY